MIENLADYDVILINTSAGKDSQATLDVICKAAAAAGILDRCVAVHCDLGKVEWKGTRELAERQVATYGIRFEVISRPQGDLLQQVEARGMWPSSAQRYCTSDHKRGQVSKVVTKLTDEIRAQKGNDYKVKILNIMGIRAEESNERAKKNPFEFDSRLSNGKRSVWNYFPIFDWTVAQVWERIRESGVQHHPAYDLGMTRLSCVFCVLAKKSDLIIAAKNNPELLAEYVAVEKRIGHTFKKDLSIESLQQEVNQ